MTKNEKSRGSSSSASMFTPAELTAKAMSMGPPHKRPLDLKTRGSPSDQPPNPESPRKKYKTEIQMMLQTSLSLVTWSLTTSTKLSYHNLQKLGELQHHRDDPENAVVTEGNVENDDIENNKEQVSNDTLKEQLYGDESAVKLEPYAISS